MQGTVKLNEVDKVEILTLQDNYIDITAMDNSEIITRALPLADGEIKNSFLAEHGFCAIVKTTKGDETRTMLFDFGFSEIGAAYNAKKLGVPMEDVEVMALSHGHSDHFGGFKEMNALIGKKNIDLVVHPGVFASPRYLKFSEEFKVYFPKLVREEIEKEGVTIVETEKPYPLLGGDVLFLGYVERKTDFEKGFPVAHYEENGVEKWDPIADDTSLVVNVKGKGLVVLSGCAHSGIVNTVFAAKAATEIDKVHAVMGGFHLSGPLFEPIIGRTTEELQKINPDYIIPTHCTGRNAIMHIEKEMPEKFILNMSGTKLTFSA
ncbi:MAG: MBL fold metallo-hydrolase [Thermodesulfobacteriota bacterium]|nr:MBL fold metallo-hydrolase [Thermodesulfobacteriota bacterium]